MIVMEEEEGEIDDRGLMIEGHQGCCFLNFSLRRAVLDNYRFGTGVDGR
jgi:hypothetical protein